MRHRLTGAAAAALLGGGMLLAGLFFGAGTARPQGAFLANGPIPTANGYPVNFADDETPVNLANVGPLAFSLVDAPNPPASLHLYVNGLRQELGGDYSLLGNVITFASVNATVVADPATTLVADYRY